MEKEKDEEIYLCPVGRFFHELERTAGRKSPFFEHLSRSGVEFLKALRALVQEGIECLERDEEDSTKRVTEIEVE
ncbi:MAG: hypothetical protein JRF59_05005 [Deltaproteobacteria bacterium]|nr:hypothetical protein [Deltaproteobacteria bacterium]MBW1922580.1 hypothetical protein [Deltaproteobacteria bacterium]MBW1950459.1 hypothetical protein [Deltaproteobacteria bacterium]MBW2007775.1 hypothetical protein [Deltaproteobacteria bacterium]MBW2101569.1 hypothetical protein [Deltaproteobacteria bacterium]